LWRSRWATVICGRRGRNLSGRMTVGSTSRSRSCCSWSRYTDMSRVPEPHSIVDGFRLQASHVTMSARALGEVLTVVTAGFGSRRRHVVYPLIRRASQRTFSGEDGTVSQGRAALGSVLTLDGLSPATGHRVGSRKKRRVDGEGIVRSRRGRCSKNAII